VLLIQEVTGPRLWKLPGGLMDPKETIKEAVIREVYEETGVCAKFEGILGFREMLEY
jgi:8-oxo-dGTP pyrophosphatase MutT (NUDIX family)